MPSNLITYEKALQLTREQAPPATQVLNVSLADSVGYALAQPVVATEPNPRFDNSEVDGYAIGHESDAQRGARILVSESIAAGESASSFIRPGTAVRILTGAPIPSAAFGVIMQEDVEVTGEAITLKSSVSQGQHIRREADDFQKGDVLVHLGSAITPGIVAELAFIGCTNPLVYRPPIISIITTGDELVEISDTPFGSQIRDVNQSMLASLVSTTVPANPTRLRVIDDREILREMVEEAARVSDLIVLSGGASVGDRDYVADVVAELGTVIFHGVSVRPGKPVLFGKIGDCVIFGLPGNPASAYVCFELFVKETLRRMSGWSHPEPRWFKAVSDFDHHPVGREDFVRVAADGDYISRVGHQGSFGLASLTQSHGLARFSADKFVAAGSPVSVLWC